MKTTTDNTTAQNNIADMATNGVKNMAAITRAISAARKDGFTDLYAALWGNDNTGFTCLPEMAEQCRKWLLSLNYTPTGKEKESSPFGYRELSAVENFGSVAWADVHNHNAPIFNVYEKDGSFGFQYYIGHNGISIIG